MYDVAIIGGGSAGYAAARTAAAAGGRAVVIEGGPEIGGLCILRGCMPSKAMLYAAEVLHLARSGKTWGLRIPKAGVDFGAVMGRKKALIDEFARHRRKELAGGDFKFVRARAQFLDEHTVALTPAVDSGGGPAGPPAVLSAEVLTKAEALAKAGASPDRGDWAAAPKTISAKHFIISTGSTSAPSPIPRLDETGYWTSDKAVSLRVAPKSLIVLGGGPVAVELAQFFCRMDVKVTLLQRSEHLLRDFDCDAAVVLAKVLRREGIRLYTNTKLIEAFRQGRDKGIAFECNDRSQRVVAQEVLFALGRIPATEGLGLEKIGLKMENGRIVTNAQMQTALAHIYAAGDCTGPHQIVHIGIEQGEIAAHNIAHPDRKRSMDYRLLTSVAFTDPQVASVGLTEKEARVRGVRFLAASYPMSDHGKAQIMEAHDGFVKLLAEPRTGEILGGACVAPMGGELIHEIIAAMSKRMTVQELAAMPHYHPTMAEIWSYPAAELAGRVEEGIRN